MINSIIPILKILTRMKHFTIILLLTLSFSAIQAQHRTKKVIFIIADGNPADMIEKAEPAMILEIGKVGGFKKAFVGGEKGGYSQTPTISAVGYNSLLTGTWVNKHNVWDNDIKAPNYHYPTIFRLLRQSDPDKKLAVFSTWLDNRTKLVGDSLEQTGYTRVDYHTDGLELDTLTYPHDAQSGYIHKIDEYVTDQAVKYIKDSAPDLTWLYLEYTDDMGHRYGDGPRMNDAIGYMDKQVGRVWNAIKYRQDKFPEDWLIVVTTDHGRDSISGRNHGGQSKRERTTWIATNAKELNNYYKNYQPGIVDIMPTIARYMNVTIPRDIALELDGTPLIGKVSIADPVIRAEGGKLDIHWKAMNKDGQVKIWLTTTNQFKEGGKDSYKLLAELPVSQQSAILGIGSYPSTFYKIVLEAPYNTVNRWVILQ